MRYHSGFLFLISVLLAYPAAYGATEQPVIGRILINRKNVFETGTKADRQFPYSWGNKLHIVTGEYYIRQELLFHEGDSLNMEEIRESERILRRSPIFRYVKITPLEPVNGVADVQVETEDVWTTSAQMSYGVAGGKQSYSLGILEHNFLGQGKEIGAFVEKKIDRFVRGLSYHDPQLLGTRWDLFGGYGVDEKGREWESHLERPFYSALSRHSEGGAVRVKDDEDRFFQNGQEVANFQHHTDEARVFAAYALRPSRTQARRVTLAHEQTTDKFFDSHGQAPILPEERRLTPVLAGYEFQNIRYHKIRGVLTFDRDEDINLGGAWMVEAGPSIQKWGATNNGSVGRLRVQKIFHPVENQVWFNHLNADGRLENGVIRNGVVRLQSQFFLLEWLEKNTAWIRGEIVSSKNLDPENQFLLGGENGLRGYSVRQFSGPKKALFTLENRRVVLYDWLHLMTIGWAAFADTGAVWSDTRMPSLNRFRSDVGVGLRLAPSRSTDPGLIRIDLAYAFQENNKTSRLQVNIGGDISFGEKKMRKFDQ